ncbi:winged helix-turn-helix domain-containing protein [Cupriavidus sp. DL-D2]|uniref:winged helix-turn-helix domain-containing protein n=1 Tax=Cupriavidus sp. DL-D2 TaxID=3144974 RepID=UPI003215F1B5
MTRRRHAPNPYVICVPDRAVTTPDEIVLLSHTELALIRLLFDNLGLTVTRSQLELQAWGEFLEACSRGLDAHICRLRKKLALDGKHGLRLRAVYKQGYRLERVTP